MVRLVSDGGHTGKDDRFDRHQILHCPHHKASSPLPFIGAHTPKPTGIVSCIFFKIESEGVRDRNSKKDHSDHYQKRIVEKQL